MKAKVLTLTALLLLSLSPLIDTGDEAEAAGLPAITVVVDKVNEVESDDVEFTHVFGKATITMENFSLGTTVNVNASTNSIWKVTVSPKSIVVDQGDSSREEVVNLDISVPPRASAETEVTLTVLANTTYTPLGLDFSAQGTTNITVKQYYDVRVSTNGTMTLDQGKNLTHRLRVTNTGNGVDNFTVTLNNLATITAQGLEIDYDTTAHEVGRDRTVSVLISVSAADDAKVGAVEALFTVKSAGDPTKSATYRLTINVRESSGGNGGNGGNGGTGDETDDNRSTYIAIGFIVGILALIFAAAVYTSRKRDEEDAENEDH